MSGKGPEPQNDRIGPGAAQADNPIPNAVVEVDAPEEPDILIGGREQIFHLLAEASEIEHTLMCSYLYAAFSLKDSADPEFSEAEGEAVARWRKTIMGIAIEEMGHLLTVANLTAAIGGLPHFARPNFPVASGYFPSSVVLRLTPFSVETLEHFIFLERPTGVEHADGDGFEEAAPEREQAYHGLMPGAQDYATVSHLYEAIRTNLAAFAQRSGEAALFLGSAEAQLGPEVVRMEGIECITGMEGASRAIDLIVEQGEGSHNDREDSHYRRFQSILEEYETLAACNPRFAPAYPVAENPVMRRPAEAEGRVYVDSPPAAMMLDLGNAVYGTLLRLLVQAFAVNGASKGQKEALLSAAIDLMHVLGDTARALAKLPASLAHPGVNSGISFTMLRGIEPFGGDAAGMALLRERLRQLASGARRATGLVPETKKAARQLEALASRF